jgi:hypothetical protein
MIAVNTHGRAWLLKGRLARFSLVVTTKILNGLTWPVALTWRALREQHTVPPKAAQQEAQPHRCQS